MEQQGKIRIGAMVAAIAGAIALAVMIAIAGTPGSIGDTTADVVVGQNDFTHTGANNLNATGMNQPYGVTVDGAGHLYVADYNNNRVLGYMSAAAFADGAAADLVIGQPSFTSGTCDDGTANGDSRGIGPDSLCEPYEVAADPNTNNLYVADYYNNRVLEYNDPFASCGSFPCVGPSANLVFGQGGSLTTNICNGPSGLGPNSLCGPEGVAVDGSGRLYIADYYNSRVLEYDSPLSSQTANRVFGQSGNFAADACANGNGGNPAPSATGLCMPAGVALDGSGRLYIADFDNSRVLEFDAPLTSQTANLVFGQGGNFTTGTQNNGGVTAGSLELPVAVAVDGANRLYIADTFNQRVLEFDTPLSSQTATNVFGQGGSFTSSVCGDGRDFSALNAASLCYPYAVAVDSGNRLYVADNFNARILAYDTPFQPRPPIGCWGRMISLTAGRTIPTPRGCTSPLSWRWTPPAICMSRTLTTAVSSAT